MSDAANRILHGLREALAHARGEDIHAPIGGGHRPRPALPGMPALPRTRVVLPPRPCVGNAGGFRDGPKGAARNPGRNSPPGELRLWRRSMGGGPDGEIGALSPFRTDPI